jgi:hypothetical protein
LAQLRVYDVADQDGIQGWIHENFPALYYIAAKAAPGRDKREGAFRGMYLGGDESLTSLAWLDEHVRTGHGPVGALYPAKTWTAPNPHSALKEGDTPSWFFFLANGLNSVEHPEWGGWGGRYYPAQLKLYRDAKDQVNSTHDARATVWRWRRFCQNEFQARMDWCVRPPDQANHSPNIILNGNSERNPLLVDCSPKDSLICDTRGTTDPDDDHLAYHWWVYREAGTYPAKFELSQNSSPSLSLQIPPDASAREIHLVLEVSDSGSPSLTSFRRVVFKVR